ncbi:TPA: H-NS histone family protein [Vibrio parahaemolyticus]|uniref:H-NS family histone-like protein n=1 Tax=Vibrio TaxID=662 RepID=UPI001B829904|nr:MULTISPECIES: H-NS family nucleoid-associated regulatory protein [Vibrio]BDP38572.1 DNA-binding protein [Vibrio alginolyticus]MCR9817912.1 H-NS histone family protein [Vibrio parahaemolyticus]BDP33539.1 DNA-binding protein [Vibrio vulnificus]HBC3540098.1 H-NS histone family protein [Vibrio parahaemolyticus]HBC3593058.1 H-NS histone family protein [Vibrio parahaemolyticus]
MTELTKVLLNMRSLRAFTRDEMTLEQLEDALNKLTTVVEERREAEELERAAQKEQEEKMSAIAKQIEEQGLDVEQLISALTGATKAKSTRQPRPAKYKYIDENGKEKTWTGQGRTPSIIQAAIDSGDKKLEDFAI